MTDFSTFFKALWRSEKWPEPEPFPWQRMLAARAVNGDWPKCISLPTASGKTACLDIAVFAIASAAKLSFRMPRRIWFVVDRRIVVDEAYERAKQLAAKLNTANTEPLVDIAAALRELSGTGKALEVERLRGGVWREDSWARIPSQPAIICSTVDQIGSALLFRAYGHGENTASIYVGLAANDSLILLDEAHCAEPFLQTLQAVSVLRGPQWVAQPLDSPFCFSIMSATPPLGIPEEDSFPKLSERAAALDHPLLQQRRTAKKFVMLKEVTAGEFVTEAVSKAQELLNDGSKLRIAIMVNRVATAEQIFEQLRNKLIDLAHVVLLTGRMRPFDRDALVDQWEPLLKAGSKLAPEKPLVVVTTQCLEVGADFSFDALVTECASLDALRQRFGRLDRLGTLGSSPGVILIRREDTKKPKDGNGDPIYGKAIYETWTWLIGLIQGEATGCVDFGIEAMDAFASSLCSGNKDRIQKLLAPAPDAPILLPAHLDLLSQTSPRPTPEPDISLFLHGKDPVVPEVRVVFRADLPATGGLADEEEMWVDILSLAPPVSPEMLAVPLYRLRQWLNHRRTEDISGDVEGVRATPDGEDGIADSRFLIWRGRKRSILTNDLRQLRRNDVVVLRLDDKGFHGLGQLPDSCNGLGPKRIDIAEQVLLSARRKPILRIQPDVLAPLREIATIAGLLEIATNPEFEREELEVALTAVFETQTGETTEGNATAVPDWLVLIIQVLLRDSFRIERHPAGGLILIGRMIKEEVGRIAEEDPWADEEDLTSTFENPISLQQHTSDVSSRVKAFVARCLNKDFGAAFLEAAHFHDLGKLDARFQILLRNGSEEEASEEPLAKSPKIPERSGRRLEIEQDYRLPKRFRHEFLSFQIVEHFRFSCGDESADDLMLHLIASHHGYARPFAPVAPDPFLSTDKSPSLSLRCLGIDAVLTANERQTLRHAYRLDSGVVDRFWRLTRRFGWWGLAYLEAVFRLGDWAASRRPEPTPRQLHLAPLMKPTSEKNRDRIIFNALSGANPLGFLAALGTMRLLSAALPQHDLQLSWERRFGAWRPVLWSAKPLDEIIIVETLRTSGLNVDAMFSPKLLAASEIAGPQNKKGEPGWKEKLKFPVKDFREFCQDTSSAPSLWTPFAAAWASEIAAPGDNELARRTRFDFTAGNQLFIGMLRELEAGCTKEDLRRSLFTGWRYSSTAVSMRWDPQDEKRQYALQAIDPTNNSKNPPLADQGANFLAVEALPLFPLVPDRYASQPGFDQVAEGRSWSWPIWICPLGLDGIRSLLTLPLYDVDEWSVTHRHALGVRAVFKSAIVQPSGRYRCFTPAHSI